MKILGVELFAMMRSGMDVHVEFEDSNELKKIRETYILHILDYVL